MIEMTAAQQHQILRALWTEWRSIAVSTALTHVSRAEKAVKQLYALYRRPDPTIVWADNILRLPNMPNRPLYLNIRESLIFSVWAKLREPEWVCQQIGYEEQQNRFRLPANKALVTRRTLFTPPQRPRPTWLSSGRNMISQFDIDAVVI